jgi:DNA-directed RNA polymerase specialized sigma54-like protein
VSGIENPEQDPMPAPERNLDRPTKLAGEPVYQFLQELQGQPPTGLAVRRGRESLTTQVRQMRHGGVLVQHL